MLTHFLRYLGFYVEEISADKEPSVTDSIADIFVLSDNFKEEYLSNGGRELLDLEETSLGKTLFICKDGWQATGHQESCYVYSDQTDDSDLLMAVVSYLSKIMGMQFRIKPLLVESTRNLERNLKYIAKHYVKCNILQSSIYVRRFYSQPHLFSIARKNYDKFITAMNNLDALDLQSDLMKFVKCYARYEMNEICRNNSRYDYYPVEKLSSTCLGLLQKYPENEQVRILLADIYFKLEEAWAKASNEYGDIHLGYCAYAHYRRGRILREYVRDYESALEIQRWAVKYKRDYFPAWYQIALCHEARGRYEEAVLNLGKVCELLKRKYQKGLLAPIEYEYLCTSILKIVLLQKNWVGDIISARMYESALRDLMKEIKNTKFLKMIWCDVDENTEDIIKNMLWSKLQALCKAL